MTENNKDNPQKTNNPMTMNDVVIASACLLFGFIIVYTIFSIQPALPHSGFLILFGVGLGIAGPIIFIVKFFRQLIKESGNK